MVSLRSPKLFCCKILESYIYMYKTLDYGLQKNIQQNNRK